MRAFEYAAAAHAGAVLEAIGPGDTKLVAGGTNLLDLMKSDVARPSRLVDVNALPLAQIEPTPDGGLRLGALARNADTAFHPLVLERFPLVSAAILAGASPQVRNMASNGGNLMQRTRCLYFYDVAVPCNKREPGSGCPAIQGLSRQHAILGASDQCIATHPSDLCVALAALEATVAVRSSRGERAIAMADFHRLPGDRPELDTTLAPDELITHITLPPNRFERHATYLKLRDRASFAFALVSVAAALELEGDTIRAARLALGGVAAKPWRDPQAEALLVGQPPTAATFSLAADHLLREARSYGAGDGNAFKIPMARRAVVRALEMATAGILSNTGWHGARETRL